MLRATPWTGYITVIARVARDLWQHKRTLSFSFTRTQLFTAINSWSHAITITKFWSLYIHFNIWPTKSAITSSIILCFRVQWGDFGETHLVLCLVTLMWLQTLGQWGFGVPLLGFHSNVWQTWVLFSNVHKSDKEIVIEHMGTLRSAPSILIIWPKRKVSYLRVCFGTIVVS